MGTVKPEEELKQDLNDSGCVQDASMGEGYRGQAELLDLSDDVLLYLLSFSSPMDLKALGHTCSRLARLICDRTLWHRVDARGTPMGSERLRWFLKHCFSASTTELSVSGYANRESRCLGIQDLSWSPDNEGLPRPRSAANSGGVDVEHFLLRMWYPHLPRYAVSPRWPDKEEAATHMRVHNFLKSGAPTEAQNDAPNPPTQKEPEKVMKDNDNEAKPMEEDEDRSEFMDLSQPPAEKPASGINPERAGPSRTQKGPKPGPSGSLGTPQLRDAEHPDNCFGPYFTFNDKLMKELSKKCSQLTCLVLEYCNIDYKVTNIRNFPPKLKKLSLRGTRCYNLPLNMSYLCKIQDRLPLLEYLNLSECEWFEPASLMPLSKLPVLNELYLKDCVRLTECVAYASLATRYGFRTLKVLDVRGSPISDSEVSAFGWLPILEELYCSPGDDFRSSSEHTHAWTDRLEAYHELDPWETEEPEYFRNKTPEPESADEEEVKPEPSAPEESSGTTPWWSHERRIIVIQPNADEEDESPATVRIRALGLQVEPGPSGAAASGAGPSGAKRPNADNVLDLVKRPRLAREDEERELEIERPVIPAPNCPRHHRIQVLNSPILIGRQQPINRPVQSEEAILSEKIRLRHAQRSNSGRNDEVPPAGGSGALQPKSNEEPQPEVSVELLKNDKVPQPGVSAPQASASGVNAPNVSVQTQAGEPQVNAPDNDVRPQVGDQPQPGVSNSNEPSQNVAPQAVNVTVAVKLPRDFNPSADVNVTVELTPRDVNAPQAANPPQPSPMDNSPPNSVNPPLFVNSPHCVHANNYIQGPVPEPQPIFVPHELGANLPQVYAPYANGPQAVIIPGNVAPINAGPQAHLLMRPSRIVRNIPPYGNQMPFLPPIASLATYRNRQVPEEAMQDGELIQDIINDMEGNPNVIRPRYVRFRRNNMRDRMHVDLDIHHQQQMHQSNALLVTDSAILRFGRADNDDINYVHIARIGAGPVEQGNRPGRSNLRILSVTGYRNITDRSLQHLATAAPHLTLINFSQTSVTQNGVDMFKAIRPNCEVIFSEYPQRF